MFQRDEAMHGVGLRRKRGLNLCPAAVSARDRQFLVRRQPTSVQYAYASLLFLLLMISRMSHLILTSLLITSLWKCLAPRSRDRSDWKVVSIRSYTVKCYHNDLMCVLLLSDYFNFYWIDWYVQKMVDMMDVILPGYCHGRHLPCTKETSLKTRDEVLIHLI